MKVDQRDRVESRCCKDCLCLSTKKCTSGFQRVVDNAGLVVYRHTNPTEGVNTDTGSVEFTTKVTEDVFILHNTKDVEITPADYLPEIDQNNISCPRCRRILKHAQKLLEKVPTMNKNDVKGICEHCSKRETPCIECGEILKKFVACESLRAERNKGVKKWLVKIKSFLKGASEDTSEKGRGKIRAQSELNIEQLCRDSLKKYHKPDVKKEEGRKLYVETRGSNFIGVFPHSIEKRKKMFADFLDPEDNLNKPTTSETEESIKRNNEYQVYSDAEGSDLLEMFHKPISVTDIKKLKKEKHIELRAPLPPVPFHSEEHFMAGSIENEEYVGYPQRSILRSKSRYASDDGADKLRVSGERARTLKMDYDSIHLKLINDPIKMTSTRHSPQLEKELLNKTAKSTRESSERTILPSINRKYNSEESLLVSMAGITKDISTHDFRYVFPKEAPLVKGRPERIKTSSELIKDTQDSLLAKAEEEKKKLEKERIQKLEKEERKRMAREERSQNLEEKRKADDSKKALEKAELEQKLKHDEKEKSKEKKGKSTVTVSTDSLKSKTKESSSVADQKETKPKPGSKGPIVANQPIADKNVTEKEKLKKEKLNNEKDDKDILKKEREEKLNNEKDAKDKLKKEKEEKLKKEKEEKLKKENDRKEKLKKEKEEKENLKKEKDLKGNLNKEEKQKKEKDENGNLNKEKYEKEKQKKEKDKNGTLNIEKGENEKFKIEKDEKRNLKEEQGLKEKSREKEEEHTRKEKEKAEMAQKQKNNEQKEREEELKKLKIKSKEESSSKQKEKEQAEREAADQKTKEEANKKLTNAERINVKSEPDPQKQQEPVKVEKSIIPELSFKQIKVHLPSQDDLLLRLVKLKQSKGERRQGKVLSDIRITNKEVKTHKQLHQHYKGDRCIMCLDSDLELDIASFDLQNENDERIEDIIIGQKVFKYKPPLKEKQDKQAVVPLLFQSAFAEAAVLSPRELEKKILISGKPTKNVRTQT